MTWTKRERDREILICRKLKPLIYTDRGELRMRPAPTSSGTVFPPPSVFLPLTPRFQDASDRNMAALRWVVDRNQR
jgi:hypothetical protein